MVIHFPSPNRVIKSPRSTWLSRLSNTIVQKNKWNTESGGTGTAQKMIPTTLSGSFICRYWADRPRQNETKPEQQGNRIRAQNRQKTVTLFNILQLSEPRTSNSTTFQLCDLTLSTSLTPAFLDPAVRGGTRTGPTILLGDFCS